MGSPLGFLVSLIKEFKNRLKLGFRIILLVFKEKSLRTGKLQMSTAAQGRKQSEIKEVRRATTLS